LRAEQVAYSMRLKDIVNPSSTPNYTTRYNAMGADVSTVLYATNADVVEGIEMVGINTALLYYFLEPDVWEALDDVRFSPGFPLDEYKKPRMAQMYAVDHELMKRIIQNRRDLGYWNKTTMQDISLERAIILECKLLGMKREDITAFMEGDDVVIQTKWAYPGEEVKEREIRYRHGTLVDFHQKGITLPEVDCYYEKSRNNSVTLQTKPEENDLHLTRESIKPGGYILLGRVGAIDNISPEEAEFVEAQNKEVLGEEFTEIPIQQEYREKMLATYIHRYNWGDFYAMQKAA